MTELVHRKAHWRHCRRSLLVGAFAVPVLLGLGATAASAEELAGEVVADELATDDSAISSESEAVPVPAPEPVPDIEPDRESDSVVDTSNETSDAEVEESADDADSGFAETVGHVAEEASGSIDPVPGNEPESDGVEAGAAEAVTDASDGESAAESSEAASEAEESDDETSAGAVAVGVDQAVEQVADEVPETSDAVSARRDQADETMDVVDGLTDEVPGVVARVTDAADVDGTLIGAVADDAVDAVNQVVAEALIGAPSSLQAEAAPILDLVASTVEASEGGLTAGTTGLLDGADELFDPDVRLQMQPPAISAGRRFGPQESIQTAWSGSTLDTAGDLRVQRSGAQATRPASDFPASGGGAPPTPFSSFPMPDAMSHGGAGQSAAFLATVFALVPQPPHFASGIGPERLRTQHTLEPVVAPG